MITPPPLELSSYSGDYGVIFSDGMQVDYLEFNASHTATISIADHKARLVT